ncbi:hypothetical protein AB3X96_06360 [Paraburkholderia sp. BR13439]|uniref:hypothetical protein n=1 Tax=Paraburkholderia sp. BR13439 TaxID=3236996 RepID=UPI0034CD2622
MYEQVTVFLYSIRRISSFTLSSTQGRAGASFIGDMATISTSEQPARLPLPLLSIKK